MHTRIVMAPALATVRSATVVALAVIVHLILGRDVRRVYQVLVGVDRRIVVHRHVRGGHEQRRTGGVLCHRWNHVEPTVQVAVLCISGPAPTSAGMYAPGGVAVARYGEIAGYPCTLTFAVRLLTNTLFGTGPAVGGSTCTGYMPCGVGCMYAEAGICA
uniref:Uncharacterized protein n=1 Tax=Anopheles melas TaxID=34690 RepID=A0A182TRB2_9DIPT